MKKWLLIILIASTTILVGCSNYEDKFCQKEGFKESTDIHTDGSVFIVDKIECDHQKIFEVYAMRTCLESDKWGDCTKKGYEYIMKTY